MVERLATRFRALLGGRGEQPPATDDEDGDPGDLPADPEWDELLAWARESDDEVEWEALIARAKRATPVLTPVLVPAPAAVPAPVVATQPVAESEDEEEWGRLLALAKAIPSRAAPLPAVPSIPQPRPPAGSIASLSARLERLSAQVPDARRRAR